MTNEELLQVIKEAKASGTTELNLSGKGLTALPPELFQLTELEMLDLSGNELTTLPPKICQLTKLKKIEIYGNPITFPPSKITKQGVGGIRRYFAAQKKGIHPLNEVKILLIGDGASGKTSLVKRLVGQPFDKHEDTTHGISIWDWSPHCNGKQIRINIWDFGGQEIQHATHQFFLSKRSLYVLVLDGRKDERTEYWLRHVEAFGGNSPVLIVLNKMDSNPSFDVNRPFLREKYPGIRDFFRISCKNGYGIASFKERLLEELAKVEMIGITWPGSWFAVKRRLEQLDRPYINADEYGNICQEADIADEESRETLLDFLNDLGVAMHFRELDLKTMHVLDPVWITEAVYKIITAQVIADSKGVLDLNALKEILKDHPSPRPSLLRAMLLLPYAKSCCFPPETHPFILRLMEKFELCYPIGKETVLIPQLLQVPEPEISFSKDGCLRFALHYPDFLPPSVFPRFMVKVHKDIHENTCWRTGVLLADKRSGAQALVKADVEARRINLWVLGERPREYLHYLRYLLADINNSFEKVTVSERVPMPDDPHISADYQTLLEYAEAGSDLYIAEGSKKRYSVHELLGLVQPKGEEELRECIKKIQCQLERKESTAQALSLLELKPSVFGVGFNINNLFEEIKSKVRARVLDDPRKGDNHE